MRAIFATMSSTSLRVMVFLRLLAGRMRCAAPASSMTSMALSGRWRSLMNLADNSAAACSAPTAYLTLWCSSKRVFRPFKISTVCSTEGSTTSTFWKRRDSAASFSKMPRYSVKVVAPMHFICTAAERGLQQVAGVERATAGSAGADQRVDLVDEQDRVRLVLQLLQHALQPLLEVAAVLGAGQQRAHVQRIHRRIGQDFRHVLLGDAPGQPSAMAVLPTPASPTSSGLFLRRRHSTWITRSTSCSRPISGSILPSRRQLVQVLRELLQRRTLGVDRLLPSRPRCCHGRIVALGRLRRVALLDAVGDEVHHVQRVSRPAGAGSRRRANPSRRR